ncbi:phage portal protein [Luteitalea sp.]|uniref:phage portal protein n=1 Tax=Luteitalea sp. TaxID=2004800 RepID=UPI0025C09A53|nr:phage portal protein [Luteitalea sp.]
MNWRQRVAEFFGRKTPAPSRRNFTGGRLDRLTWDWIRSPLSGDKELETDLLQLRSRSRDAARNQLLGKRFVRMAQNNVIGRGIRMRPVNMWGDRTHDTLNDGIARAWTEWGRPLACSADGMRSWLDLQRLCVSEQVQSGEALFQIVYGPEYPHGMALHPIDADRLDERLMRPARDGQNEIRYGIELNAYGRPVAFHILTQHPSEHGRAPRVKHDRIPAEQMIYLPLGVDERVGRLRGVPSFAVALRDMKHLDGAQEASVVALRAAACQMAFITTKDPNGNTEVEAPPTGEEVELVPGMSRYLGLNQEVQSWNPHAPSDNYPDFSKVVKRDIAAGLGTSLAFLTGDWSDANMSALRVAYQNEQDGWMAWQESLITHFCQRVFDAWLPSAMLAGAVKVPEFDVRRASAVQWLPRRWTSPKPLEDIEADEKRVALGTLSRTRIAAREGIDLWEVWEELAEEQEYAAEEDLNVEPPRKVAGGAPTNDGQQGTDDAAPGDGPDTGTSGGGGRSRPPNDRHQLRITRSAV